VLAFLVTPFLRSVTDVDIVASLGRAKVPILAALPETDFLVPPDELSRIEGAVRAAGGQVERFEKLGHVDLVLDAHRALEVEAPLYRSLFEDRPPVAARVAGVLAALSESDAARFANGTPARARLERVLSRRFFDWPAIAAAFALASDPESDGAERRLVDWLRTIPPERLQALPLDALASLLDFADPSRPLDTAELDSMTDYSKSELERPGADAAPERLAACAAREGLDGRAAVTSDWHGILRAMHLIVCVGAVPEEELPPRLRLPPADRMRQAVRLLLKTALIPDRVVAGGVEVWDSGAWRPLNLPPSRAATTTAGGARR
jgi:hypothetical protein